VLGVVPTEEGNFVILVDPQEKRMLPLDVGLAEALAIHVRLERQRFPRPLTVDLLDDVLERLSGRIVRVQIDGYRDETFLGTIFVEHGKTVHRLDARPSDAIALALGHGVPIFIDREVMATHSLDIAELEAEGEGLQPIPDNAGSDGQKPIVKL
jgi:bifunctional DNase/RNase